MKALLKFLSPKGFVVLTGEGRKYEAWAYEGSLDFESAEPVRFGLGNTPVAALNALDWQLAALAKAQPAPMVEIASRKHHRPTHFQVDDRELATILAALRFHQDENLQGRSEIADLTIRDIATDSGKLRALGAEEIDALCQRLNTKVRRGLDIEPPPVSKPPLYRVVYVIDLPAANPHIAAQRAQEIMADPESLPPILQVIDHRCRTTTVDLSHPATPPSA